LARITGLFLALVQILGYIPRLFVGVNRWPHSGHRSWSKSMRRTLSGGIENRAPPELAVILIIAEDQRQPRGDSALS